MTVSGEIKYIAYVSERIITVRIKIYRGYLTIKGVYAPEEGKAKETELFYEELQKHVDRVCHSSDHLTISGDLNARIGQRPIPEVVGIFAESTLNVNGHALKQFAAYNELKITNSFFR